MEVTIISAQGLKNKALGPFSHRLRPFVTITTYPPPPPQHSSNGGKGYQVYITRVDDQGGVNPTWGDKFHVPVDASFFANRFSCVYLQLYTKRLVVGRVQLGWCQIPVSDIGYPAPQGSVRHLSYRIRATDGTRGHGIVNLAIKLTAEWQPPVPGQILSSEPCDQRLLATHQTVIGTPVTTVFSQRSVC